MNVLNVENHLQINYVEHVHLSVKLKEIKKYMRFKLIFEDKEEDRKINEEDNTILNLLKELEVSPQTVVAKKNDQIVTEDAKIEEGDTIKIIQIIYGG